MKRIIRIIIAFPHYEVTYEKDSNTILIDFNHKAGIVSDALPSARTWVTLLILNMTSRRGVSLGHSGRGIASPLHDWFQCLITGTITTVIRGMKLLP